MHLQAGPLRLGEQEVELLLVPVVELELMATDRYSIGSDPSHPFQVGPQVPAHHAKVLAHEIVRDQSSVSHQPNSP
jgi:hypothetical protein